MKIPTKLQTIADLLGQDLNFVRETYTKGDRRILNRIYRTTIIAKVIEIFKTCPINTLRRETALKRWISLCCYTEELKNVRLFAKDELIEDIETAFIARWIELSKTPDEFRNLLEHHNRNSYATRCAIVSRAKLFLDMEAQGKRMK